jgi:predicted dinucleotide-binding enzyme
MKEATMTTAIIGVGNIGKAVARHLVKGGERVILAGRDNSQADALAKALGEQASAAPVGKAIAASDTVVFAVWFDTIKELVTAHADALAGKVVVDPSNPIKPAEGGTYVRTLPDDTSAAAVISALLPRSAHYVKAFNTLGADALSSSANRSPRHAALIYATDDDRAAAAIERLIGAAGFDAVKAGGLKAALRTEMFGDLHQYGGLKGKVLDAEEARAAIRR